MTRVLPLLLALLLSCSPGDTGEPPGSISIDATIAANPLSDLSALVSVETQEACEVAVQFQEPGSSVHVTGASVQGTSHEIVVVGMRSNTDYSLVPIALDGDDEIGRGDELFFTTGDLPVDVPDFEVVVHDPDRVQPGITVFGPVKPGGQEMGTFLIGVDETGEVVWYHRAAEDDAFVVDRMARALPNGNLLTMGYDRIREISVGGEIIEEVAADQAGYERFHHDVIRTPEGTWMTLAHELQEVDVPALGGPSPVLGDRIVEVGVDGEVLWEWSTFDHLDTTRFPTDLSQEWINDEFYDWTHANAVVHVEQDDALLVSLRHQHWVVKLDRATGEVLWRLGPDGDFELQGEGGWFYGQHTPVLDDDGGALLLYDNGNDQPDEEPHPRAAVYAVDEDTAEATLL